MSVPEVVLSGEALTGITLSDEHRRSALELPREVKLGRIRPDPLLLQAHRMLSVKIADYLDLGEVYKALPASVDYYTKAAASVSRMYLNDRLGDCVIAGKYHAHGAWTAYDMNVAAVGSDSEVQSTYSSWCGPGDNGCIITRVLDLCRSTGVPMNGVRHKIDGYADCDNRNKELTKAAIYLFGAISIGINLPSAWTNSAVWDVTSTGIVGGHDVTILGYDDKGVYIASWGRIYLITWAAYLSTKWIEESWVMLAPDWYNDDQLAPSGVNVAALKDAMNKIGGGVIPSVDPPTPVPPTPVPPTPDPTPPGQTQIVWLTIPNLPVVPGTSTHGSYVPSGKYTCKVEVRSVKDLDPPTPLPPPEPFMASLTIPTQQVEFFGLRMPGVKVPEFQVNVGTPTAAGTLPDWLAAVLKEVCAFGPRLPEPLNHAAAVLCWFLNRPATLQAGALPPILLTALRLLCQYAYLLPAPYGTFLQFICRFFPQAKATASNYPASFASFAAGADSPDRKGPCSGC